MIGAMYAITPIFFIVGSIIVTVFRGGLDKRLIIIAGVIIDCGANFCIGPSEMINLPNKLWLSGVGLVFFGLGSSAAFPNALPEVKK